jgi:transcriptional regulator with XRE-family HTH domain
MNDRKPNTKLKAALLEAGMTQRGLAEKTKIPENYISMVIHGKYFLDEMQMLKVAVVLGREETRLF